MKVVINDHASEVHEINAVVSKVFTSILQFSDLYERFAK